MHFSGDCLALIRIVGSDIFQPKWIRIIIQFLIVFTSGEIIFQLYLLLQDPDVDELVKYSTPFVSTIYVSLQFI
jgi:hypothetical protein